MYVPPRDSPTRQFEVRKVDTPIRTANGMTTAANAVIGAGGCSSIEGIIICGRGTKTQQSGLFFMSVEEPYTVYALLNNYYGRPFNSPSDVCVLSIDGSVWFTDPDYGFYQKFRYRGVLPNHVYVWEPSRNVVRVADESLVKPNGIAFTHNCTKCYISDTAAYQGTPGVIIRGAPATIFVYDVVKQPTGAGYGLVNKRVFAYVPQGAPEGLSVDAAGNVFAASASGVCVFNASGEIIGRIDVPGGCANFAFVDESRIIVFNGYNIWEANLSRSWQQ
jgi:gluconolactonase